MKSLAGHWTLGLGQVRDKAGIASKLGLRPAAAIQLGLRPTAAIKLGLRAHGKS